MEPGAASAEEPDGGRYRPADAAARVAEAAATLAFSRFGGRRGRDCSDGSAPSGDGDADGGDGDLRRRLSEMLSQRESLEAIKGGREVLDGAPAASVVARRDSAVSAASVDDDGMSLDSAELGESDRQGDARLGGGQSQRSLSVSILEDKDCGVLFVGNDAADAGNGTKPDPSRAPERGSTPAAGGWGYESSIGSVTSLFRGSLVRVMGRKRGDSTSSAARAAPTRPAPLPYRPRRRGATVRRRRDSSPEEGDHIASSLLMMRSWGGKASPPTAWDGARVRREGPRHVSWNIHDNYRHESDARRVAVAAARPRRLRATGGGEARVSWDLDDYNRSPRRERLSSLLSDISASIGDAGTRREELVDMLYDELGVAASSPPTPPNGS
ncbi:hypothetical protein THAOC_37284 [Thalassiosira oceanica]|uniref:Uncharacterized protein n=1 Tax=Thalassiosira oceanica TaxID=159749 RepID=K0R6J0_THAOC|nr:hypothetical protein THAOC_37284 [Thalassiosira oceanica]|eukprot:EJK44201.1 hypothetical protein THAOC_37284 [Thalassiosira oceanica]